jgi:hypothetical protein
LEMYNSQLIPYSFFYGGTLQFCLQYWPPKIENLKGIFMKNSQRNFRFSWW